MDNSLEELSIYKLRISMTATKHTQLLAFLKKYAFKNQWVFAYEMQLSTNPHIHACFKCNQMVKRQAMSKYIKRHWESSGNSLYSLVLMSLDDDEDENFGWPILYVGYCIKQKSVYWNGFTVEEIVFIQQKEKEKKAEIAAAKLLRKTQIEQIYVYIEQQVGEIHYDNFRTSPYYYQNTQNKTTAFFTIELITHHTLAWYLKRIEDRLSIMRNGHIYNICYTLCVKLVPYFATNVEKQIIFKLKESQQYNLDTSF